MRALLAAMPVLAACAAVDPDPEWLSRAPVAAEASAAPAVGFAVPAAFEPGFDDAVAGGRIAVGDRALFGVRLDGDGETETRFVRAEVLELVENPVWPDFAGHLGPGVQLMWRTARVRAIVFDGDGRPLGEDTVELAAAELEHGLMPACRGEELPLPALSALRSVLSVVRRSSTLRALLWQVVDVPSVFSLIWHLGVKVSLAENFAGSARGLPFALGSTTVPTWVAPIELRLNGAPALRCRVQVADPRSPIALCAGVVAIQAASPSHPQRTVTMQLLGARRGARP